MKILNEFSNKNISENMLYKIINIKPMRAHKLDEYHHKIKYPALVQRKLDGFRCLSNIDENIVKLYSKNMKEFVFLHHIKKEVLKLKNILNKDIYLDGELYEFGLHLHKISSLVMKKYATKNEEKNMLQISYYIFDMFDINHLEEPFFERYEKLKTIFKNNKFKYLKLVKCKKVNSYNEIKKLDLEFLLEGYEGIIVRNIDGIYKLNSKSYDVLRTKEFKRKEFEIIGAKKAIGAQKDAIIWKLKCDQNNKSFWAIPIGTINDRIKIYKDFELNPEKYMYKKAVVKFLDIDKDGCVIRNPIIEKIF